MMGTYPQFQPNDLHAILLNYSSGVSTFNKKVR